ncbi:MAG: 4-(cytidine 5'-diphospho)-2-C-methyl-D-erythritol kinase, partial [Clostridia bacterium]|nr:4-(cytidine 5'-diphospho)-2-C-methyl-D-erythritol kinase [Clostridia bacterium]
AGLGADVPFCVMGGTRLCRGIGEVMEPIENKLRGTLVVAIGGEGVSTPVAFAELDRRYGDFSETHRNVSPLLEAMKTGDPVAAAPHFYNMFEEVIEQTRPMVGRLKAILRQNGAVAAMMSGSGPSVWGLFEDSAQAERAKEALVAAGARAYTCEMIR